jgi:4-hydroxy-3-methylbut-2-en-1-yl diphosphate synthase IspG/GcpE
MHGDLVLQALTLLLLFRFPDVVINGLEQALDVLVLSLVEGLQLAVLGALVNRIGEADAATAFAGSVGADLVELVDGLEAMA